MATVLIGRLDARRHVDASCGLGALGYSAVGRVNSKHCQLDRQSASGKASAVALLHGQSRHHQRRGVRRSCVVRCATGCPVRRGTFRGRRAASTKPSPGGVTRRRKCNCTHSGSVGTSATHTESSWIFLWGGICEISVMMGCPCSTIVGEESMKPAVRKAGSVGDAIHSPSQSLKIFPSWQTSKEIVHVDSRAATSENSPRCTRTR